MDQKRLPTYDELLAMLDAMRAENNALTCRLAEQEKRIADLEQQLADTRAELADTKSKLAAANRNSSNSSKPPSSDIVKPAPKCDRRKHRRKGAQFGHARNVRPPFPEERIDESREYAPSVCPSCGGHLVDDGEAVVLQQAELVEKPVTVTEHRATPRRCSRCGKRLVTPIPEPVRNGGLCGPRLTAFAAFLKGGCHASAATVQAVFRDVLDLSLSTGFIMKLLRKTATAMNEPYRELLSKLPSAQRVNVDETGHRENGEHWWTWVFRTADFTVFRIADTRGSAVLDETLGPDFSGFLGADFFSAYRAYMEKSNAVVQFCLAHLIRDVRFLCESTDATTAHYGEKVLDRLRRLFAVLHRKDALTPEGFQRRLEEEAAGLLATVKRTPERNEARNLANRFREYGEAYVRFVTHPEIAPTNNEAEQAIRFCVIDRCITQGTRSEKGRAWCERIWTAAATCRQRGGSLFRYLEAALEAHFHGHPSPSLLA